MHLKRTLQVRDLAARAHARAQAAARSAGHLEGTDLSLARLRQRKIPEAELDEYRAASGKDMSRVQSLQQQLYKAAKHRDDAKALQLEKGIGFRLRRDECIEKVPYQRTSGALGTGAGSQGQPVTVSATTEAVSGTTQDGAADGVLVEIVGGRTNDSRSESCPSGPCRVRQLQ